MKVKQLEADNRLFNIKCIKSVIGIFKITDHLIVIQWKCTALIS